MSWEAIGAIGQAVSALALILVFVQLRHAREGMQRAANQSRMEGMRTTWLAQLDPELAAIDVKVQSATGATRSSFTEYLIGLGLDEVEVRRYSVLQFALWQTIQLSAQSADRLSPGVKEEMHRAMRINFGGGGAGAKWFEATKERLNPEAVRYVENVLAQPM
jgi:hypothetical protein